MADQEIERLKVELRGLRTENKLVGVSFVLAFFVTETLLPSAVGSSHLGTSNLVKLTVVCCFLGAALFAVLLTVIYRLRKYRSMRHSERTRMQEQILYVNGKGKAK